MIERDGLLTVTGRFDVAGTVRRLRDALKIRGVTLFAEIDHAAGALEVGLELRPTVLVIFGSAKAGTPLMQADQRIGIDLPLKILVWQDMDGSTQISWMDPSTVAERHRLGGTGAGIVSGMTTLLHALAEAGAGGSQDV